MSGKDRLDHPVLRNFVRSRLDHDDLLLCRSDCQRHLGNLSLGCRGVKYKFSVNKPYLCCRDGAVERNVGNTRGDGRSEHSCEFRAAVLIYRHDKILQCHVISVILREERTHRAVDDTVSQDRVLGCLSFSLIESTWDLSNRVKPLIVFYAKREEVNSVSWFFRCRCSTEHGCIAIVHQYAAVCLLCDSVNVNSQSSAGKFHFILLVHVFLLYCLCFSFAD